VVRRILRTSFLAAALASGSAIVWIIWAENEYTGGPQAGCPFGNLLGGPRLLVAAALSLGSAAVVARTLWRPHLRPEAVAVGLLVGIFVFVAILVAAAFFAAGLRCFD
jgi:hypothetical protein